MLVFSLALPPPPRSTPFPYTTLFRSAREQRAGDGGHVSDTTSRSSLTPVPGPRIPPLPEDGREARPRRSVAHVDRKSTRLNSSHEWISYAVFCLKKKKNIIDDKSLTN